MAAPLRTAYTSDAAYWKAVTDYYAPIAKQTAGGLFNITPSAATIQQAFEFLFNGTYGTLDATQRPIRDKAVVDWFKANYPTYTVTGLFAGKDPTITQTDYGTIQFNEVRAGVLLKSMPGYPDDGFLPRMQLAPSGRVCFYDWIPKFTGEDGVNWYDMSRGIWANNRFGKDTPYDKICGDPSGGTFGIALYNAQNYQCAVNNKEWNTQYFAYGVPVLPLDEMLVKKWIADGRKPDATTVTTVWAYKSPWTSQHIISVGGKFYYRSLSAEKLVQLQMQYYVDAFLKEPYQVIELVPYGKNYPYQIWDTCKFKKDSTFVTLLGNIDFLIKPTGEKTFWDKLLAAAPVIVSALATVVTLGAGTPALVATAGALVTGTIVKLNAAQQKMVDAVIAYGKEKSAQLADSSNINTDKVIDLINDSNGTSDPTENGTKRNWFLIIFIILVVLALIYFFTKNKGGKFKL